MNKNTKRVMRLIVLGVLFFACCLMYIVKMATLSLTSENIGGHKSDGTTERSVVVKAQRGLIYDREGRVLVSNRYTYDLTFDYSVMSPDDLEKNVTILKAVEALSIFDSEVQINETRYPLTGAYPDYSYSDAAHDSDSSVYSGLVYYFKETGLRAEAISKLRGEGMSRETATNTFDAEPLKYISASMLGEFIAEEYMVNATKGETDERFFYDDERELLMNIRYDMVVSGFSRANDYVLVSSLGMDTVTSVLEWGLKGVGYTVSSERVYEYPGYASHILGQTGPIYAEDWDYYRELDYNMNATVGISGCELAFEEYLRGSDGVKVIVEDENGNIVNEYMKTEPIAGRDVYLTVDIDLQIAAEDGLNENVEYVNKLPTGEESGAGAVVAMSPTTGEILALASYPTFDLSTLSSEFNKLSADKNLPLLNRAVNGTYAPGSTFKPCVSIAALCEGIVSASETVECAGVYRYYDSYQPRCWVYNSTTSPIKMHGHINVTEAVEVSCNCYYYDVGRRLGIDALNKYSYGFGLGLNTGIEIPESVGSLAGPDYREDHHLIDWKATDTIAASIGQSDNAFTPIQLSSYISTLVNRGTRYSAHLLYKVVDFKTGETLYQSAPEILSAMEIPEDKLSPVIDGMERVVSSSSTISRFMSNVPVRVAGKTGTAQVGGDLTDNGLFVSFAPSDKPQIVVSSVIEHCGGGSYASLVAARVMEEYFSPAE